MKKIVLQIALTSVCPLECSYCCMEFASDEDNKSTIYNNNVLVDRIVNLIDYLTDKGYHIELGSGWGEPLLIFKYIKYIFDNVKTTANISYELLSSFSFDEKNNYKAVFTFLNKYITLFNNYNISYVVRWSIHCEYLKNVDAIYSHYKRLKSAIPVKFIPMMMINTKQNIWQFNVLKNKIDKLEYHLVLNDDGECPLLHTINFQETQILKSLPYYVRGIHLVDRIVNKNFSFTGTQCHLDNLIAIMPSGKVVKCINDIYRFSNNTIASAKLITEVSNEYVEKLGISNAICPHKECNICSSDPVDIYDN